MYHLGTRQIVNRDINILSEKQLKWVKYLTVNIACVYRITYMLKHL